MISRLSNGSYRVKIKIIRVMAGMCSRSHKASQKIISTPGFFTVIRTLLLPQQDFLTSARDSVSIKALTASDDLVIDTLYLLQTMLPQLKSRDFDIVYTEIKTVHDWQWEDDYHNFSNYDAHSASTLEERYRAGDSEYTIQIRNSQYRVDFHNMKQYNLSTSVMRNVQRNPIWTAYNRRIITGSESQQEEEATTPKHVEEEKPKKKGSKKRGRGRGRSQMTPTENEEGFGGLISRVFKKKRVNSPLSPNSMANQKVYLRILSFNNARFMTII
jgi:hypothetical protein